MGKVDVGYLHMVEYVRFLESSVLTVGYKTVPNDEWTFKTGQVERGYQTSYYLNFQKTRTWMA
jgi:hypothetical protein